MDKTKGKPLLPRLSELFWSHPTEYSAAFVLFLSPMLTNVSLNFGSELSPVSTSFLGKDDPGDYTTAAALRMIHSRSPRIERLSIHIGYSHVLHPMSIFEDVRSLSLQDLKDPAIISVACKSMCSLQKLEVSMYYDPPDSSTTYTPGIQLPVTLTELSLDCSPSMANLILGATRATSLSTLTIKTELRDEEVKRCVELISTRFASSLRNLALYIDDSDEDAFEELGHPPVRQYSEFFEPLYTLRQLTRVAIYFRFETPCCITEEDMRKMAAAWPALQTLHLPFLVNGGLPPTYPISALELLAKGCPSLSAAFVPTPSAETLKNIDLATVPSYDCALVRLHLLGDSWKEEIRRKGTAYVMRVFPKLQEIGIMMSDDFEDD